MLSLVFSALTINYRLQQMLLFILGAVIAVSSHKISLLFIFGGKHISESYDARMISVHKCVVCDAIRTGVHIVHGQLITNHAQLTG